MRLRGAQVDLSLSVGSVLLLEHRNSFGTKLPRLGDQGPAVTRTHGVRPSSERAPDQPSELPYAQEIIAAARAAAAQVHPKLPVTAYLLEHNVGSKRAAERAGLHLVWRGADAGNPDPSAVRLVYSDRALDDGMLNVLVQHE